jgi:SAM-dependent methyltransferase
VKEYDREYFERWYRGRFAAIGSAPTLKRKIATCVAMAEFVLDRPLQSILDIGCGEGRWQPVLYELRPDASYIGIDSSQYAVDRFGTERNLRMGKFEQLEYHVFEDRFDLVVCSDVMHYLTSAQIDAGLPVLADLVEGVAFLETFTRADEVEGDMVGFKKRQPGTYREMFREVGLVPIGMQFYVPDDVADILDALEVPG